jgi:hypothetical protein
MGDFQDMMTNMKLKWQNEDELPEVETEEIYNAMFECSIVNGVRYFPYMQGKDGEKFWLIKLKK